VNIVVQANTKTDMQKMDLFKGENAKFLPKTTFQDKQSLFSGADRIDLYYFGPGGTDGDTWVVIPALGVVAAGDAFAGKAVTLIDRNNGGSASGYLQALTRVAAEIKGVTTVVTGHAGRGQGCRQDGRTGLIGIQAPRQVCGLHAAEPDAGQELHAGDLRRSQVKPRARPAPVGLRGKR
jgi:glyoxylase-like metal-dependent hydrolase (beta-lactamase superfamily II)